MNREIKGKYVEDGLVCTYVRSDTGKFIHASKIF